MITVSMNLRTDILLVHLTALSICLDHARSRGWSCLKHSDCIGLLGVCLNERGHNVTKASLVGVGCGVDSDQQYEVSDLEPHTREIDSDCVLRNGFPSSKI